ncbi:MAG TPA: glycosyltransferase family 39 protein [Anaerolineales bacterium]|nr:glycosyltransferase family 39 protein [Anaerolineales bacterium]
MNANGKGLNLRTWPWRGDERSWLVVILVVSIALRMGAAVYLGDTIGNDPGTADQLSYHTLAQRVLEGHGFSFGEPWWPATRAGAPTAHWSYLYTFFLAGVYALFGVHPLAARLLQAVAAGIGMPLLIFHLGRRLFSGRVGLLGAAWTALYAYFIYYAATLMTEAFYIVAVLASLLLALELVPRAGRAPAPPRRWPITAAGLGLSLGAAVLLRQVILLFIPFLLVWILMLGWKRGGLRSSALGVGLSAGLVVAMILPFTAYNYQRFGRLVLLNTNAGFAFFWANHPIHGTSFQSILLPESGSYGALIPEELVGLDEAALDQELLRRGLGFVRDDPKRYLLLSASRIADYFRFWPSSESSAISNLSRVASFGLLWPVMLYGVGLTVFGRQTGLNRRASIALLIAFVLSYTAVHLLSWSLIRYRLPVDAVLLIFAGAGTADIADRIRLGWSTAAAGSTGPRNADAVGK